MVVAFRLHGSYGRAAKACGTKPEHVRKWVERFRATGGVKDAPRSGRPSLGLQRPRCRQILERRVAAKLACYKMADDLKKSLGVYASPETVRRALRGMGNRALRRRNVLRLTEEHKANRLRFAKHWSRFSWRNVVVSDSRYFCFYPKDDGDKVWVAPGEDPPTKECVRGGCKVHVYAGVSKNG